MYVCNICNVFNVCKVLIYACIYIYVYIYVRVYQCMRLYNYVGVNVNVKEYGAAVLMRKCMYAIMNVIVYVCVHVCD